MKCTFPELENLSKTSFTFFAQITTKHVPLVLLAQSAYFSVSFGLLRWEVGGALSRATASDEVKGEGGRGGEGHGSVQTFTVSDISEATSDVFDLKKLQKERTGGRKEKQYYILSRGLCLTKTTLHKGTGTFSWGVCIRAATLPDIPVKSRHWF